MWDFLDNLDASSYGADGFDLSSFDATSLDSNYSGFDLPIGLDSSQFINDNAPDFTGANTVTNLVDHYTAQEIPEVYQTVNNPNPAGSNWDQWNKQIEDSGGGSDGQITQGVAEYQANNNQFFSTADGLRIPTLSNIPGSANTPANTTVSTVPSIPGSAGGGSLNSPVITPATVQTAQNAAALASAARVLTAAATGNTSLVNPALLTSSGQISPEALAQARALVAAATGKPATLSDLIDKAAKTVQANPWMIPAIIGGVYLISR